MKKIKKLQYYMSLVESIRFDNENGSSYAFIQLLAYNREILYCLRDLDIDERVGTRLEAVSWVINEYLGSKFSHRHRSVFDEQKFALADIFREINEALVREERQFVVAEAHAVAA